MFAHLAHVLARPLVRGWRVSSSQSWRRLPHPPGQTVVHASGSNPDRVLLVGSSIVVGFGAMSHDLALAGALARELSALTGRGADVQVLADQDLTIRGIPEAIKHERTSRFDAIVVAVGSRESQQLMPTRRWRKHMHATLTALTADAPRSLRIFIVGIMPHASFASTMTIPAAVSRLLTRQERRFDAQSARCCDRNDQAEFIPFDPPAGTAQSLFDRQTYESWATLLAPAIIKGLNHEAAGRHDEIDENARVRALLATGILDSEPEAQFDRIVETARDLFGTSGAALNFIDRERQWSKAVVGLDGNDVPRDEALCDLAIRSPHAFVAENLRTDDRLAGSVWAADDFSVQFYAGYPIEMPDGSRIGTLCITDEKPRTFTNSDAALLRQLALQAQALLWSR